MSVALKSRPSRRLASARRPVRQPRSTAAVEAASFPRTIIPTDLWQVFAVDADGTETVQQEPSEKAVAAHCAALTDDSDALKGRFGIARRVVGIIVSDELMPAKEIEQSLRQLRDDRISSGVRLRRFFEKVYAENRDAISAVRKRRRTMSAASAKPARRSKPR